MPATMPRDGHQTPRTSPNAPANSQAARSGKYFNGTPTTSWITCTMRGARLSIRRLGGIAGDLSSRPGRDSHPSSGACREMPSTAGHFAVLAYRETSTAPQELCGAAGSLLGLAAGAKAFCESELRQDLKAHALSLSHLTCVATVRIFHFLWIALLSRVRPY